MLYTIVGMLVIILDQLVKFWVDRNINWTNPVRTVIPDILSLVRVQNDGAAFSFLSGSGARVWFIVITGVFAVLVVLALATNFVSGKFGRWCLVLVTAGGLSNMIDRIRYGYVIDMFKIELFDFAVFNVADIFITVFCIAFIIYILFGGEKTEEETDEFDDEDYEEEDRPARRPVRTSRRRDDDYEDDYRPSRSGRKASRSYDEDDYDDDDEYEEQPRRRTERSAAAANAYSEPRNSPRSAAVRKSAAPAKRTVHPQEDPYPSEEREPQPARKKPAAPAAGSAQPNRSAAAARRKNDDSIEKMFAAQESPRRSTAAKAPAPAKTAVRPAKPAAQQRPAPAYDPNNPFAEWEQANQRVSAEQKFNTYREDPAKSNAKSSPASVTASASDDMDIDAILNEFK